jgi:hypothetical protein
MSTTIKVCPVCSVSWYADKPEKHMMTCTAKDFVPYPGPKYETVTYGVGYNEDVDGNITPLTDEQRLAFDNALKGSLSQTVEVGLLGCVHKWDFITDKCLTCGATYQWAIDR